MAIDYSSKLNRLQPNLPPRICEERLREARRTNSQMQSFTYQIVVLSMLCVVPALSQTTYTIQTVAGSSLVGDGVSALNAQLSDAEGLASDSQGNVYIADPSN